MGAYDRLFRHVATRVPAELTHRVGVTALRAATPLLPERSLGTPVEAMGLRFANPLGVAAGYDKDAESVRALARLGFGAVEVGTVTARPQPGNPRPRLFRLPADRALVNRMGFNNAGADVVAARLAAVGSGPGAGTVLGVNIGKSKAAVDAVADYRYSARVLGPYADYVVVNVSSPNTPGLRDLQGVDALEPLLAAVREEVGATPLLVKITADLDDDGVDAVADLAMAQGLDGIVATNTTLAREGLASPADVVAARLAAVRSGPGAGTVLGVNIGRSKAAVDAVADHRYSARVLGPYADYVVVNVSSPNTPGLRDLQGVDALEPLLAAVREEVGTTPLLVKITADLDDHGVDAVADLAVAQGLDGIVATNTTVAREGLASPAELVAAAGSGGLSGAPLVGPARAVLARLRERVGERLTLVSVGGIDSGAEARARLDAGATLVQAYTGFVYGGPAWPRRVLGDL